MQRKGERSIMKGKEYCRYIRTYSELEGLQHARTVLYCASTVPQGVLVELRREQGGRVSRSRVLAPQGSFGRVMLLLRYLCENGIEQEQWLEVLEDMHLPYRKLEEPEDGCTIPGMTVEHGLFCGIC